MSEHSMDETMNDVTRSARLAVMLMAQASEQLARRIAEIQRAAARESNERATVLRDQISAAQDAARGAYQPLTDSARFAQADAETAAAAWATAAAWADVDPQAAAAQASLREQIVQRWEVDPEGLRDATTTTTPQPDRLAEAMDPQWRESATIEELEQRWSEAQSNKDRPGAEEALAVLDTELHERFGLDVEKLRRSEHDMAETLWHTASDHAAAEADRASEASEQASAAGWENQANTERNQEAIADDDAGQEAKDSIDAREAEGKASAGSAAAEIEHGQARADAAAMDQAGAPARSQQVRLSTAKAFGRTTQQGVERASQPRARKATKTKKAGQTHERGK